MFTEPVTLNEPVIRAEPVNGNAELPPLIAYDAVNAKDAVATFEYVLLVALNLTVLSVIS
jgi:hypothetical protein